MTRLLKKIVFVLIVLCMFITNFVYADVAIMPTYDETDLILPAIAIIGSSLIIVVGIAIGVSIRNSIKKQKEESENKEDGVE